MPFKDKAVLQEYQRTWRRRRRRAWFRGKRCAKCDSRRRLELDHIDPAKKVSHKVWSWSEKRREAELAKCQVLCAKCHKAKSQTEKPRTAHGRARMFQGYGCRCAPCVAWKRADNAKWNAIRRARRRAAA